MKIKEYYKTYKKDLLVLLLLYLIFLVLLPFFFLHQGSVLVDSFTQNLYIPSEIIRGKLLYKDIGINYPPLSYQFNALLLNFFGLSTETIHIIGIINTLIILGLVYIIGRTITDKRTSFLSAIFIMELCCYNSWISNFIFPYASAMTYALSSFLAAVLFCILYIKNSKPKFMVLSFFFMGISVMCKIDFALFVLLLLLLIFLFKPFPQRYVLYCFLSIVLIPFISLGSLFFQGVNLPDIYSSVNLMEKLALSKYIKDFYTQYSGLYFSWSLLTLSLRIFLVFLIDILMIPITTIYFLSIFLYKITQRITKGIPSGILYLGIGFLSYLLFYNLFALNLSFFSFTWMPISTVIICLIILIFSLRKVGFTPVSIKNWKNISEFLSKIEKKKLAYIILCCSAFIASSRSLFMINLSVFGTFLLPLLTVVNIIFLLDYLPKYISNHFVHFQPDMWKNASLICLFIVGFVYLRFSYTYIS
ncbi:MAG: glycosyltransferase family 39 protein, partial [Patescibacteria group bacterium]|nr:glycosyltransferase family 39 protein [Patescibacteria group bacterium]